jgi:hypothetical protein
MLHEYVERMYLPAEPDSGRAEVAAPIEVAATAGGHPSKAPQHAPED